MCAQVACRQKQTNDYARTCMYDRLMGSYWTSNTVDLGIVRNHGVCLHRDILACLQLSKEVFLYSPLDKCFESGRVQWVV